MALNAQLRVELLQPLAEGGHADDAALNLRAARLDACGIGEKIREPRGHTPCYGFVLALAQWRKLPFVAGGMSADAQKALLHVESERCQVARARVESEK